MLQWGLAGFAATSVLCGFAWTAELLIIARGLQGIAGALLVPSSLALIVAVFNGSGPGAGHRPVVGLDQRRRLSRPRCWADSRSMC